MNDPRARLAIVAGVLAVLAAVGMLVGGGDDAAPQPSPFAASGTATPPAFCVDLPDTREAVPAWFPEGLPMPEGSYVSEVPDAPRGTRLVIWTAPITLDAFVRYVLEVWKQDLGWRISRGDREVFEAEATVVRDDTAMLFRATKLYCDESWTQVLIGLSAPGDFATPTPTPSRRRS